MLGTRLACPRVNVTAAASPTAPAALLTPRQIRAASAAVLMTILLAALDQTIVGVAVPTIARQLGGFEWMAWVISGYLIAATVVTPLYGKLSDLYGRRSVMSIAIALFLVASVGCALAQTLPELVLARVLQGAGGGGLIATAQSVVADVMPLRERGRYQSYISIVWAVASLLGPVVGGVLTEYLSWPWIFWINLPVGLLALVLVRSALRAIPVQRGHARIDGVGALLLLGGLTAALIPITRVGQGAAWSDGANVAGWALAAALLTLFVRQQRHHPEPIVPLALLADRSVQACSALLFIGFFVMISMSVLVPLRLQIAAGFSAADAALRLLPLTLAIPAGAFIGGRWMFRSSRALPAQRLGVWLVPIGAGALGFIDGAGSGAMAALAITGIGIGLQLPTALITVQQAVPREQMGTVTALTAFFRQLGGAIGIAVLSSVLLLLLRGQLPVGVHALDGEGLGRLLDAARGGHASGGTSDLAFRQVMWLTAALSLPSLWFVSRLPDLRLQERALPPAQAAAESR
jgi:EmrB/QacA subfamily drug resistance transporter